MIEFIDGEEWCRWNGILMSPESCLALFGVDGEVYFEDDFIDAGIFIYTDKPAGEILLKMGSIINGTEITFPVEFIQNFQIKPYNDFYKDYPNFNKELHDAFHEDLDKYYANLKY